MDPGGQSAHDSNGESEMARSKNHDSGARSIRLSLVRTQFGGHLEDMGMSAEQSQYQQWRLQKLVELRWQREVIEGWLGCSGTPTDSLAQLHEMLGRVNDELQALAAVDTVDEGDPNLKQVG